jgi:hypothetical protein
MAIDCEGKHVLEPSAGSGNIVKWLKAHGAKSVSACEKHETLRKILSGHCNIIAEDFFAVSAEDISHVQMVVMNPPFSNAARHILHAWDIAPEGCEIISLCNSQTLKNDYTDERKRLLSVIEDYGDDSVELGQCFSTAERKTDVEVSVVRLFKPVVSEGYDYEGFFLEDDPAESHQENGMMTHNEVRALVNSYVGAVRCYDKHAAVAEEMNRMTAGLDFGMGFEFKVSYSKNVVTKEDFATNLQRHCWKRVFSMMKIERFVTSGVMSDLNKFINTQSRYPFTMRNVYRMVDIIVGTRDQNMKRAIVNTVDAFTEHTHENRFGVEGWKTNAGHLLNRKFIVPYMVEVGYSGQLRLSSGRYSIKVDDLSKALCYITGRNAEELTTIDWFFSKRMHNNYIRPNTWYCCDFFEFKCFKKGTMHIRFQREEDWEALNKAYAKIKGAVLPESTWKRDTPTQPTSNHTPNENPRALACIPA